MAASNRFPDDFAQYLADTARELAETGRRTERTLERMSVIAAAVQRDSKLATEALHAVASGLGDIASGLGDVSSGLRDFTETSYGATDRAVEALIEACEESRADMRRLTELSDMLAAYLSVPGDEDPAPGQEESG